MLPEYNDDSPIEVYLFLLSKNCIERNYLIDHIENNFSFFEISIFNAIYIIRMFVKRYPEESEDFAKGYSKLLHSYAYDYNIVENLPCGLSEFIAIRFNIYKGEIDSLYESKQTKTTYLPSKLIYYFFEKPLSLTEGFSIDMLKHLTVLEAIVKSFRSFENFAG